jgi:hypothetical protein
LEVFLIVVFCWPGKDDDEGTSAAADAHRRPPSSSSLSSLCSSSAMVVGGRAAAADAGRLCVGGGASFAALLGPGAFNNSDAEDDSFEDEATAAVDDVPPLLPLDFEDGVGDAGVGGAPHRRLARLAVDAVDGDGEGGGFGDDVDNAVDVLPPPVGSLRTPPLDLEDGLAVVPCGDFGLAGKKFN